MSDFHQTGVVATLHGSGPATDTRSNRSWNVWPATTDRSGIAGALFRV